MNEPLPENHVKLINKADSLAVSSISCWEVFLLEKWNKIELPLPINEWLNEALEGSSVTALPITASIAEYAGSLAYHHKDPAEPLNPQPSPFGLLKMFVGGIIVSWIYKTSR